MAATLLTQLVHTTTRRVSMTITGRALAQAPAQATVVIIVHHTTAPVPVRVAAATIVLSITAATHIAIPVRHKLLQCINIVQN